MRNILSSDLVGIREAKKDDVIKKVEVELTLSGYWVIRVLITTGETLYIQAKHGYLGEEVTYDTLDTCYDVLQCVGITGFEVVS